MKPFPSSDSNAPDDLVELGRIAGAYGVQGWIRVQPYSPDSSTLLDIPHWWLKPPVSRHAADVVATARHVKVDKSRVHSDIIVARLTDVSDRTDAETLKGWTIWVSRAEFAPLDPDEHYWVDLVGCRVYGQDGESQVLLGEVFEIMDNGAHGILRIARATEDPDGALQFEQDAKGRRREVLVPFVSAHVHTVDTERKKIFSDWPVD